MAYRQSIRGMQYVGYPARIFFEMTNYGRGTQKHLEKMVILEKWYSHLRAHLPVVYEKKEDELEKDILPLLNDVFEEIARMNELYDPTFEDIQTCSPNEKLFCLAMRGVFERLDVITAKTKLIDKQGYGEEGELISG